MPLRAIVFDFDGVIVDTEPLHLKATQRALGEAGMTLDTKDYYERYLGFDDEGLFRALASDRGVTIEGKALARLIDRKSELFTSLVEADVSIFPGARECVRRCAIEEPLAIASGAFAHEIDMILRRIGLRDAFQVIVGAEDAPRGKPAPDPYARAIELLRTAASRRDLSPGECVAIEDSHWGLESARAAGLRCVAVTHTYGPEKLRDADFVARTLDEITLDRLRAIVR